MVFESMFLLVFRAISQPISNLQLHAIVSRSEEEDLHSYHRTLERAPKVWDLQVRAEKKEHVFSQGGDSGAPVLGFDAKFIGIMFGGDPVKCPGDTEITY